MPSVFLVADPHFGHRGVCKFLGPDGAAKLRPWDSPEEMDEALVSNWNDTVRPKDKVYVLGDVVINRKALATVGRLNGDKVLIKGNHDIFRLEDYTPYFRDVRGYHVMNGLLLSHIPVHEASLARFNLNVHGHLHANRVMKPCGVNIDTGKILYGNKIDYRYHCVSVEQTDFRPILFEHVLKRIKQERDEAGFIDDRVSILNPD